MSDKSRSTEEALRRRIRELEAEVASLRTLNNAPYLAILEDMTECVVRWQAGGILLFVNEAYCRLFNKTREELIGTSFYAMITPDDLPMVKARLDNLTPENPISVDRHRAEGPGGKVIWMEWLDRLIVDADGNPIEYQSVGRDITERVAIQDQLREIEKSEAVTRHSFEIAHDLNNMFTVILGQLELLKLSPGGSLDPLEAGVKKGLELLEQMRQLRYSYLWHPQDIDLKEHVSRDQYLLRELAGDTAIEIRLPEEPCVVRGDAIQIDQLLWNLVRNANQASSGKGTIRVSVGRSTPESLMAGHRWKAVTPTDCCVLQVADEGSGIPEHLQPAIYGRHISTRPEGQGLGLKTVKSIVDAHDGSITYTTSRTGTMFEVAFPAA